MLPLEVERGAQAHSSCAATALIHALLLQISDELVTQLGRLAIKCKVSALTTHVLDHCWMSLCHLSETLAHVGTGLGSKFR